MRCLGGVRWRRSDDARDVGVGRFGDGLSWLGVGSRLEIQLNRALPATWVAGIYGSSVIVLGSGLNGLMLGRLWVVQSSFGRRYN